MRESEIPGTNPTVLQVDPPMGLDPRVSSPVIGGAVLVSERRLGKRPFWTAHPAGPPRRDVLVLGNAYGVLPYQPLIAQTLAARGFRAHWFPFSGQGGVAGHYCLDDTVADLAEVVAEMARLGSARPHLLAHCGGSVVATEYAHRHGMAAFASMAVYGLLFAPHRRRKVAERMLVKYGVQHAMTEEEWHYPWLDRARALSLPLLLCHARDSLNGERAREEELTQLLLAVPTARLRWFESGYDSAFEAMPDFADAYADHFAREGGH